MNEFIEDLKQTNLFFDMQTQEIDGLLHCLCPKYVRYAKDDYIVEEGERIYDFGIMLSGHGSAIKWDLSGRVIIISLLKKDLFCMNGLIVCCVRQYGKKY